MKRWLKALTPFAMLTFLGDDCGGVQVEDPSFRLWTSDTSLAAWDVTAGRIHKAPTWSDADPGVEFLDTPTEIAQTLTGSADCARVSVMGKVEDGADLEISTGSDSFTVSALDWTTFVDYISVHRSESNYDEETGKYAESTPRMLRVRKKGPGKVILAKIEISAASGCGPSTYGK